MNNVTFINNSAPYGNDIGSYPVKAILYSSTDGQSFTLDNVASGQVYDQELKLALVDYDNQIITSQSSGLMTIDAVTTEGKALGLSTAPIVRGVATFKDIIFEEQPGSRGIEYSVKSTPIDTLTLVKSFGVQSLQDPFFVNFRY